VLRNIQKLHQKLHNLDDKIRKAFDWLLNCELVCVKIFEKPIAVQVKKSSKKTERKNTKHISQEKLFIILTLLFSRQTIRRQFSFSTFEQNKTKQRDLKRATQSKHSEMRKIRSLSSRENLSACFSFPHRRKNHSSLNARSEKIKSVKFKIFL
jgi:hypothetical protein